MTTRELPKSFWLGPALALYNLLYLVAFIAWTPWVVWRVVAKRDYREGVGERLGFPTPRQGTGPMLWVHGVSVGETKASIPLVERLTAGHPELEVMLSATTPTGHGLASRVYPDRRVVYYPLDFWRLPAWSMKRLRPNLVLLMELELWPNFVEAARRRNCPVVVVNGRISERSYRRYSKVRKFLPQLSAVNLYCMQNQDYAERIARLGIPEERIRVTGNIKYDGLVVKDRVEPDAEFSRIVGRDGERLVLVAGSTHGGEELTLHRIARELRARTGRQVVLVLAPRHPERDGAVAAALRRTGFEVERLTSFRGDPTRPPLAPDATLLVDTIGDLERAYSVADLVFVGGSLTQRGGQNMLEPAAMARPTFFGPNTWNFRTDVKLLLDAAGAVQVGGEEELLKRLTWHVENEEARIALGRKGRDVILGQKGAAERTLQELTKVGLLPGR